VCAADLAKRAGDPDSGRLWLETADQWSANIEHWTLTTYGTLAGGSYFLRITRNGDPNAEEKLTIQNGGGDHDQRDIVDPSFLELVRLGIRLPDSVSITRTLPVIDSTVRVQTPKGDTFHRYPFDGYGEQKPGDPYNGKGHAWPLLSGERGVYEVLAGHLDSAQAYLNAMRNFANPGGMLPEQVYETTGEATGSAAPLVWAHAEYVILTNAISSGNAPDRPQIVYERYGRVNIFAIGY
jgi:glucoamylase